MAIEKVLKRRDGSSLVVGIILAWFLLQPLSTMGMTWSYRLVGVDQGPLNWKLEFVQPWVAAIIHIIFLEILIQLYVFFRSNFMMAPSGKKSR